MVTGHRGGRWEFWIDRGGTFTDVVARDPHGRLLTKKLLSENPGRYDDAALAAIRGFLGVPPGAPIPVERIAAVRMGTTVATNALLERRGDAVVLVATRGFGDALRIGYQDRPRLFDLHIRLPVPLWQRVVEADERIAADGTVVSPLDEEALRRDLEAAYAEGIRAAAVAFMHGYRYPAHEQRAAAIARDTGFAQVSVSHEVSPLMKLVSRGDTTVVDACLSPVLRRHVERLRAALPGVPLTFMQSNGGLAEAGAFRGKDAILSGPAGGVVGMAKSAAVAGHAHVIGFDMGGTSTDVSRFDGEFERTLEWDVAGVRLRTPMMLIHTVAAGGGSILRFEDGRCRVGPDSAGADPGPACYRRGGPLTLTDCNLMLGRLQPAFFPAVFGPGGNQPPDIDVVQEGFRHLAREVEKETGSACTPEELAEGFLAVAVENMAAAIRKISVERGCDVSRYVLNCFGGAAGQHACRVADALGMREVLLHPHAGVLSAYGIGLADMRLTREQAVEVPLDEAGIADIGQRFAALEKEGEAELVAQGVARERLSARRRVFLKYAGTDAALDVPWGTAEEMRAAFAGVYRQRFGFAADGRAIIVESIQAEIIGRSDAVAEPALAAGAPRGPEAVPVRAKARVFLDGEWREAPVFHRADLLPGDRIAVPALIVEDHGSVVLERGWEARVNEYGHLLLEKTGELASLPARISAGTAPDPVLLEIFNSLFMSIAEQMGSVLEKTASSVNIKERLDFSCALFDARGELVANAPHMPVHLGSMSESVKAILRARAGTMREGDVFALNAPYHGGTHLPDITVIRPVFDESGRDLLFFVAARGHHADVGGITPGSMPPGSRDIAEEGVVLDDVLLVEAGRFREAEVRALFAAGPWPARDIDRNIADLKAQLAACEKGVAEIRRMVQAFTLPVVQRYMAYVQDNAEESVRRALLGLRDGAFRYEMDDGSVVAVRVTVDRDARRAVIDFTGTSPRHPGNFNAPAAVTRAAVLYVFRCLVDRDIPLNGGCLKPLEIIIPADSMLSPRPPAAVAAGNVETSQYVVDALFGALGVMAAAQGTMNNLTFGNAGWQYYETLCGGAGAGPGFDGADAVHTHMTNSRLTDPEVLEWRFPVRVESFAIRRGSGGRGRWRGGDGVVRRLRFLEPVTLSVLAGHRRVPPFGLEGGEPGLTGRNFVERASGEVEILGAQATVELHAGDAFVIETPGGGGFGAPPG